MATLDKSSPIPTCMKWRADVFNMVFDTHTTDTEVVLTAFDYFSQKSNQTFR